MSGTDRQERREESHAGKRIPVQFALPANCAYIVRRCEKGSPMNFQKSQPENPYKGASRSLAAEVKALEKVCTDLVSGAKAKDLKVAGPTRWEAQSRFGRIGLDSGIKLKI